LPLLKFQPSYIILAKFSTSGLLTACRTNQPCLPIKDKAISLTFHKAANYFGKREEKM